jgi:hypothetical protein
MALTAQEYGHPWCRIWGAGKHKQSDGMGQDGGKHVLADAGHKGRGKHNNRFHEWVCYLMLTGAKLREFL